MSTSQIPVLLPAVCVLLLFIIILLRIIYIFVTDKDMRRLQCYRIMALTGVYQIIIGCACISMFTTQMLPSDYVELETIFATLGTSVYKSIIGNEFVLALNRVSVICGVRIPSIFMIALQVLSLLISVVHMIVINSDLAGYVISEDGYTRLFDPSKPYSEATFYAGFYHYLATIGLTFACYIIILVFLKYKKYHSSSWSLDRVERNIAVQSCSYFVAEVVMVLWFVIRGSVGYCGEAVEFAYRLLELFVSVCLPSIIYLSLNSVLQAKFFLPLRGLKISQIHQDSKAHMSLF